MTTMLSLILAFMLSIGGSPAASINPAGCPGDGYTGIQAPIDNNRPINRFFDDYREKTASRPISKKILEIPLIKQPKTQIRLRFSLSLKEELRLVVYMDSMNLYQAFGMNPVNFNDPFGQSQVYPGVPGTSYGEMELYHKDPEFKRFVDGYYRGMGNTIFNPLTLTTIGLTIINPAAGIAFGLGALTNTYYHSVKGRLEEGQSFGGSLGGGVLDLTGVSDIQASGKVKDPYKSGELVASGSMKLGTTAIAIVYGAKMALSKLRSASDVPTGGNTIKYNAKAGRFYDANTGRFIKFRDVPWPENYGFVSSREGMARTGQIIDRYGPETGKFLAPEGTPYSQRGLPGGYIEYHKYEVIRPFPWKEGYAKKSVEFNSIGGGYQYMTTKSIKELVAEGYLKRIE
jgi:hypothetical protein